MKVAKTDLPERSKLATALTKARNRARLSQRELAARLHVSTSTIADWELGNHQPKFAKLSAIAEALGISTARLFEAA